MLAIADTTLPYAVFDQLGQIGKQVEKEGKLLSKGSLSIIFKVKKKGGKIKTLLNNEEDL
jgi:hypothetical protein